jgi:hypothetical protein
MSKAVQGAAMLAGAAVLGAFTLGVGGAVLEGLMHTWMALHAMEALALGGLSMEVGAIADALTSNRGQNITTRQAASYRQIIYGVQRVGGVEVYRSTTGATHNQFNYVIVIATHKCHLIESLYLDGRKVHFNPGSQYAYTVRDGIGFGGDADGNEYIGPNGAHYNFGGKVYCEARYGEQLPGDIIGGLTANDPTWTSTSGGSPYLGGCTYVYLKIVHDDALFQGEPEIRFTVHGKEVYDPRTSTTAFSTNMALLVNDVFTDTEFGLGDPTVNQAQLIAAANVCDEQVPLAGGGYEARYSAHWHYDTSVGPGDAIATLMTAAEGRLSRIGGEWYIWPAYWQGPSASFGADHLVAPMKWSANRSYRELFNRVTGTYTAPNYPYNVAGNVYDRNGWYQGTIQNNFPFAFQPTNYPQYAADVLHGYSADEYLAQDGGVPLSKEISRPCVLSVSQAQRLAKIALRRNRRQGTGSFVMGLQAFQLQPLDTFLFSFAANGWEDKLLEVSSVNFQVETSGTGAPRLYLEVGVQETAASDLEWSPAEELTPYDVPSAPLQAPYTPAPPTNMQLTSSAATALLQPDGTVIPRIKVTWDTPLDIRVKQIQMQVQAVGATTWTDAGLVDVSLNIGYIAPIVSGTTYNVRIRSLRANGAASVWVEIDGFTAGYVLSTVTQDGYGRGSLIAEARSGGTAAIICRPFSARFGNRTLSIFPAGAVTITGLTQQRLYWVYYIDPTTAGGNVSPIATLDKNDFLGRLGYFLIDSITTPSGSSGSGGSSRYSPSVYDDQGGRTTENPGFAFDGDTSNCATVSASSYVDPSTLGSSYASGSCSFHGFVPAQSTSIATLTVIASCACDVDSNMLLTATINGTVVTLLNATTTTDVASYTASIPAGTSFSDVSVLAEVTIADLTATTESFLFIFEIYIDT